MPFFFAALLEGADGSPVMRYLLWAVKLGVFLLLLSFAVKNTDTVTVRYYLGIEWLAPLIFVMLVSFCAGVAFGVLACLPRLFRLRRAAPEAGRGEAQALR